MILLLIVIAYFVLLFAISRLVVRKGGNNTFFRAGRRSPWYMVAFGMVGASISGVTFISVPGMVLSSQMTYLQVCIGFILGYVAVAYVLLPVYYRLNLTSIYAYLGERLGHRSYQTGAWFFLLSKMVGAAVKFYVVCLILQQMVLSDLGVPFPLTVAVMVLLIWLYTRRGGVRTLVFTDMFQTVCLFTALLLIIYIVVKAMNMSVADAVRAVAADERSRVFVFDDWLSPHNFWKQLLSGAFIVVVMTGLDQDMMQKNLTCRTLREAQKDMCSYGVAFLPANLLFLALGVLLAQFFESQGVSLPTKGDELLPMAVNSSQFTVHSSQLAVHSSQFTVHSSQLVESVQSSMFNLQSLFVLGIVAASFSSADSALTSLTTCYCIDIKKAPASEDLRRRAHIVICLLFMIFILAFDALNNRSLIDAIYTIVGYTYGPLLGLFAFGLFTRWQVRDRWVPVVCIASPFICYITNEMAATYWCYHFGYELLLLNGLLSFLGLVSVKSE